MSEININKAVILARGLGTRMRKENESAGLTEQQAKVAQTGVKALTRSTAHFWIMLCTI